ncbi:M56 family metallopeptidase [Paraglaciecola aquimarina]|uniref:Protein TonB n=1 Tax=Paraglaciecola algarum TaxID=3050085 RepID=A0ABS9D219_9ALTE|nr:M56 family metallopeptidase [Paraglaciecola sp. G1-23]MCF2946911.1 M56 family metallopeptidase [Paraglaciecola sp. G1-23]
MINWLLSQLLLVSCMLLILIFIEAKGQKALGAKIVYMLWLLLPLSLLVNNIPQSSISVENQLIYHYIVNLKTFTPQVEQTSVWLMLWSIGTFAFLTVMAMTQWKFNQNIGAHYSKNDLTYELPKAIKVYSHKGISGPVLSGVFRPVLLLPLHFKQAFTEKQQTLILRHELTHYKRGDNIFNLLALLLLATFWFNPLFWLAYRSFRRSQELACDASVLTNTNTEDKISYSKALIQCSQTQPLSNFAIYSPYSEKKSMLKRIENIKHAAKVKPAMVALSIVISATALGGIAIAGVADKPTTISEINMATPIIRIEPKYPLQAAKNRQEGSVILEFDITAQGTTDNIKVIDSFPDGVFDKVGVDALKKWEYKPRVQGGQAQRQSGLKVQLDFRMDPPAKSHIAATSSIERIKVSQ